MVTSLISQSNWLILQKLYFLVIKLKRLLLMYFGFLIRTETLL